MSDEDKTLNVTVTKAGETFLTGVFDVPANDYTLVKKLLSEVDMTRPQAASLLAGYMHARDVGPVTEDMGKISMLATVFLLNEGETDIVIPLEQSTGATVS